MGEEIIDSGMSVGLQEELLADLTLELEGSDNFNSKALLQKVINAIREVKEARNYPMHYTDLQIDRDLRKHYSKIRRIALADYDKIGAEGETHHSEGEISRTYENRKSLFAGIYPLSRI